MNWKEIQKRAERKRKALERKKRDPRFRAVLGRLVHEGLLKTNTLAPTRARATVEDALWAGEIEPRVLELLPAILARRPKLFLQAKALPDDLDLVVRDLRRGRAKREFRGVPPEKYAAWQEFVRIRGPKQNAVTKTYRLQESDLALLETLKMKWGLNETAALRRALELSANLG